MKILQVIPFFAPTRGGSVIVPYNLSLELSKKGHKVTIITTDFEFDEDFANSIRVKGVEVIPFKSLANLGLFLYSPAMKAWLERNIQNFDVAHLHNFRSYQNNIVHKYAMKNGVPYILQAHGSLPKMNKKFVKGAYDLFWGNTLLKDAKGSIAVSKIEMEQYKERGIQNLFLVSNGLNIENFDHLPEKNLFKQEHNIEKELKLIMYLGRIDELKGIPFLIEAFKYLNEEYKDVFLVIVGPGDIYKRKMEKLAAQTGLQDKIEFIEEVDNVLEAYRDAEIIVYASKYEIFGLVPIEAIMCGIPVIVSENTGCGQIIKDIGCGLLVQYGDVVDLHDKMRYLLENPEKGQELVRVGQNYIPDNLSWENIIEKIETIYNSILTN